MESVSFKANLWEFTNSKPVSVYKALKKIISYSRRPFSRIPAAFRQPSFDEKA